ncbi:MAG: DUF348 domain-containing protein [Anaerolineales bacterium]|nr:DUF348 domain-containing protein [Anaerolineales bacterium]
MNSKTWRGFGFLFLALAISLLMLVAWLGLGREQYVVYADGDALTVHGSYNTVNEVVLAAGLAVSSKDTVYPALSAPADPQTAINVVRAQKVVLRTAEGNRTYWTQQTTIGAFLTEIGLVVGATDEVFADGARLNLSSLDEAAVPNELEIGDFKTITIVDGGTRQVVRSGQKTVGAALAEAGITLYTADGTDPPQNSLLTEGAEIRIARSRPVTIEVDGRTIQIRSRHTEATAVVAEAGIHLVGDDYTIPGPETALTAEDVIQVVRVTEDFRTVDTLLPYESTLQPTDQLEIDQQEVIQPGVPGILRQRLRVRYENGTAVGETLDGEWLVSEPQDEIVGYGTNIVVRTLDTPDGPIEYWRRVEMRLTSYRPNTSGKPRDDADYGITASGLPAGIGVVAVDPKVVPFRSEVYVPNYGRAIAGDTGGGVLGRWVDLGYPDDMSVWVAWSGYVDVYYLTPVPPLERINFLIPTTLP